MSNRREKMTEIFLYLMKGRNQQIHESQKVSSKIIKIKPTHRNSTVKFQNTKSNEMTYTQS